MGGRGRRKRRAFGVTGSLLALAFLAALALATGGGDLHYSACVAERANHGCAVPAQDVMATVNGVAVSPDGRSVYATDFYHDALATFDRASDGSLTYVGCISNHGLHGCAAAPHSTLGGAFDVAVSPDGKNVFLTTEDEPGSLTEFDRAPNGALTYAQCFADRGTYGCDSPAHESLGITNEVAVTPDGRSLYVAGGYGSDSVSTFDRAANGALRYVGCIADRGENGCDRASHRSLEDSMAVAISPDGKSVYVGAVEGDALTTFARDPNGELTFQGCLARRGRAGCEKSASRAVEEVWGLTVSPDNRSVYAVTADGALVRFDRGLDGSLDVRGCIADRGPHFEPNQAVKLGCKTERHNPFGVATDVVVSEDGSSVYVAGNAVTSFRRSKGGSLSERACYRQRGLGGCTPIPKGTMGSPEALSLSPDNTSLYVAADDALTTLRRGQ